MTAIFLKWFYKQKKFIKTIINLRENLFLDCKNIFFMSENFFDWLNLFLIETFKKTEIFWEIFFHCYLNF